MNKRAAAILTALALFPTGAGAQPLPPRASRGGPVSPGGLVIRNGNNTGGGTDYTIARGATGADTYTTNSAAGGNSSRPDLAVPNGSGGGTSGSDR